jgi:hypothetical protein
MAGPESRISNPHDAFEDLSEKLRNIRLKGANTIAEGLTLLEDLNRAQADAFFGVPEGTDLHQAAAALQLESVNDEISRLRTEAQMQSGMPTPPYFGLWSSFHLQKLLEIRPSTRSRSGNSNRPHWSALPVFVMVFRWIVNAGLLAVPIGATIGVLLGIESHRQATGQAPLFTPGGGGGGDGAGGGGGGGGLSGGGSGTGSGGNNGITIYQYCQQAYGISPPSKGTEYTCK